MPQVKSEGEHDISQNRESRRNFLKGVAGATAFIPITLQHSTSLAATLATPPAAPAANAAGVGAPQPPDGYQFFSTEEAAFIEAMVTAMCPADDMTPDGVACGLATFMDRQLAGGFGSGDRFDHSGLGFFGGAHIFSGTTNGRPISTRPLPPGTPRWGSAWKRASADWYAHAFTIVANGSCYSHPENYLSLDPTYHDAYGQPLLRMTFDWRDNEVKMSKFVTQKLADLAHSTRATIVGPATPRKGPYDVRVYQTTHVTGGTAMGADPATSVVSPHLQHWDAENLFIVGASVYPQNSGYNPTGPLGALALRLGDDLVSYASRPRRL